MPANMQKARELFLHAVGKLPAEQWEGYVAEACGSDAELAQQLKGLLKVHQEAGSFLDRPVAAIRATGAFTPDRGAEADAVPLQERPGTVIGPYKLLQQIGEGGFGVVFMAEQQEPIRRKVALKILKPGMDTRQVVARFEAERQALAIMDHPNIAHVFDGGQTPSGRPYFVLELVRGTPITEYCDENHLDIRERLDLFLHVCQAVQHAHQKGVIHRDIKPSNVMIASHDGTPVVKVIDFGVAKALSGNLTDKTLFTGFEQMIGTPLYMSPEQAGQSSLDVDTRSDIYSLGVLLYELLTGTTPFDKEQLSKLGYDEMRRLIREEEPPKPSTRISTLGDAAETAATNRKSEPRKLSQQIRGELDWIVMKALEKDRNRRYETASGFATDVQRYLKDEPVQACPPSAGYRLRKFLRRNRWPVLTASLLIIALLAGVVGLAISNVYISWEQEQKEAALKDARDNYDASEANLALARAAVDKMYTKVAGDLGHIPHMQPYQRELLQNALGFYEEFAKRKGGDPEIRLGAALAALRVGQIQYGLGQRRQGEQVCRQALAPLQQLVVDRPSDADARVGLAEAHYFLGNILKGQGRSQQAEIAYGQAFELLSQLIRDFPKTPDYRQRLAAVHNYRGEAQFDRPDDGEMNYREAIHLSEELLAGEPENPGYRAELAGSHNRLGLLLERTGRPKQAEDAFRLAINNFEKAGGQLNREGYRGILPAAQANLARLLGAAGRNEEAERLWREAILLWERYDARFPDMPTYRQNLLASHIELASFLARNGRSGDVANLRRATKDLIEKLLADARRDADNPARCLELAGLARALWEAGEAKRADQVFHDCLELVKKHQPAFSADAAGRHQLASVHQSLGVTLQRARRLPDAAAEFRKALTIFEQLTAEFPKDLDYRHRQANAANFLGIALRTLPGKTEAALDLHRQAIPLCEKLLVESPDRPLYRGELVRSHYSVGIAQLIHGRWSDAEAAFRKALADAKGLIDPPENHGYPPVTPSVQNDLAWLLATCPDEKIRSADQAVQWAKKAVAGDPRPSYWNTLGVAHYRAGNWNDCIKALDESARLRKSGDSFDWFFLAMAHQQLGNQKEARQWFDQAAKWMDKHAQGNSELRRFRAEAAALLKIEDPPLPK